jgi:SAM-dependent methyltransferase
MSDDYRSINQQGWSALVDRGCEWTRPFAPEHFAQARTLLDPCGWLPWEELRTVLCLASGGGQQGPLFAALGLEVTVVDLASGQLERDRQCAQTHGLSLETRQLDMLDLHPLHGRDFDLVYQPVSANYVPEVRRLYAEVARVLKPGGRYLVEHWNQVYIQMPESGEWDGEAYRIVHPQIPGRPVPQSAWRIGDAEVPITTWQYIHPLGDLLGGLCDAGFAIERFTEPRRGDLAAPPGSPAHLAAYLAPSYLVLARRTGPASGG